jgi:hypothetical protein
MKNNKKITFTALHHVEPSFYPKPAFKLIPDWYKNTQSYLDNKKGIFLNNDAPSTNATIKKCIPVFDALTSGYILVTPVDMYISKKDDKPYYIWAGGGGVSFHPIEQAPHHPHADGFQYAKWLNCWSIKTPSGYSTFLMQPMHRETPFEIFPGIIDTDTYNPAINIIFTLKDKNFTGLVPAGTPIVQVLPFKRDDWIMAIGTEEDYNLMEKQHQKLRHKFFDSYKTQFWSRKEYK